MAMTNQPRPLSILRNLFERRRVRLIPRRMLNAKLWKLLMIATLAIRTLALTLLFSIRVIQDGILKSLKCYFFLMV